MRKPIKNFEGIYEISDDGYVITLKRDKYIKEERQTKGYKNKKGHTRCPCTIYSSNLTKHPGICSALQGFRCGSGGAMLRTRFTRS